MNLWVHKGKCTSDTESNNVKFSIEEVLTSCFDKWTYLNNSKAFQYTQQYGTSFVLVPHCLHCFLQIYTVLSKSQKIFKSTLLSTYIRMTSSKKSALTVHLDQYNDRYGQNTLHNGHINFTAVYILANHIQRRQYLPYSNTVHTYFMNSMEQWYSTQFVDRKWGANELYDIKLGWCVSVTFLLLALSLMTFNGYSIMLCYDQVTQLASDDGEVTKDEFLGYAKHSDFFLTQMDKSDSDTMAAKREAIQRAERAFKLFDKVQERTDCIVVFLCCS